MARGPVILGAGVGLAAGVVVLALVAPRPAPREPATGPVLSDCGGPIRELVIQYVPRAAPIVAPVYRDFLGKLPAAVTVHVVCPDRAAWADLRRRVGPVACTLSPVCVGHAMSAWSRDRWLALSPADEGRPVTLLRPRGEAGATAWPARAGDARIAGDLAAALGHDVRARRSRLYFDGGDVVADGRRAFVTPRVALRNVQRTVASRAELLRALRDHLKRDVVLLAEAPDHHAGMFMMPVGDGTVLVGSPALAARTIEPNDLLPPCGADFTDATQRRFDAVAAQCAAAGCRVIRVPVVPGRDGRAYLTCLNAILDRRAGRRIVYMPVYRGADALNAAAAEVWQGLGYDVQPVDCTSAYAHFGSLRCLVNVLRRG